MLSLTSDPRFTTLIFSVFIALAAGTPYLYGVYSPQLINRCNISPENAATISFAANIGTALGGLPAGLIIDKCGPRVSTIIGSICIFLGYFNLYYCFLHSISSLLFLSISMVLIGFGSIISYFTTLKTCTMNFPNHKGTAGAFSVSSFGLSALIFSAIATNWFKQNTSGLLKFLAIFCGSIIVIGSFFLEIFDKDQIKKFQELKNNDDIETQIEQNGIIVNENRGNSRAAKPMDIRANNSGTSTYGVFLGGHKGSLAQLNLGKDDKSYSSLFSYSNSIMSRSSSSVSSFNAQSVGSTVNPQFSSSETLNLLANHNKDSINIPQNQKNSSVTNSINNVYNNSLPNSTRGLSPNNLISNNNTDNLVVNQTSNQKIIDEGRRPSFVKLFGLELTSPRNSFSSLDYNLKLQRRGSVAIATDTEETPLIMNSDLTSDVNTRQLKIKKSKSDIPHTSMGQLKKLLTDKLFLLHYLMLSLSSSMGQLYIYSVGFIVQAQLTKREAFFSSSTENRLMSYFIENCHVITTSVNGLLIAEAGVTGNKDLSMFATLNLITIANKHPSSEAYQALQVSLLSLFSFSGRLLSGPMSDLIHKKFKCQRLWLVIFSLTILLIAQILVLLINTVDGLAVTSVLIGCSYGSLFGVYPAVIAEAFGSQGFTTTWGLICTGPLIGLYFLTKIFGHQIDKNSEFLDDGHLICRMGKSCYNGIFEANIFLCIIVFVLMFGLIYKNNKTV
ncbi:hypothetical protein PACTADRAFT_49020 [Pachysolen tannophilus NRRL Y-2460]|uniref:Nodulin-like domain-containing protein n=1 Tax=Pachysolen tannophilus NRRL Y-2460 TaxID=669874 RepID=A0A1E4TZV4_PACTA|nr:hypothetical protein PACTADRAFT_49020 [Pachysolen tannophilus NRRL Y-2460]